jgi:hypothetical protein
MLPWFCQVFLCIFQLDFTFKSFQFLHGCSDLSQNFVHGFGSRQNTRSEWLNHMSKRQCGNASLFEKSQYTCSNDVVMGVKSQTYLDSTDLVLDEIDDEAIGDFASTLLHAFKECCFWCL